MPSIETPTDAEEAVLAGLTYLIRKALKAHDMEGRYPARGPDASDHFIGETGTRVKQLRQLRHDFENEMGRSMELDQR